MAISRNELRLEEYKMLRTRMNEHERSIVHMKVAVFAGVAEIFATLLEKTDYSDGWSSYGSFQRSCASMVGVNTGKITGVYKISDNGAEPLRTWCREPRLATVPSGNRTKETVADTPTGFGSCFCRLQSYCRGSG
jgi:hypothetical protein